MFERIWNKTLNFGLQHPKLKDVPVHLLGADGYLFSISVCFSIKFWMLAGN